MNKKQLETAQEAVQQQIVPKLTKEQQIQAFRSAMHILQEQVEIKIKYTPIVMQAMSNLEQVLLSLES